MCSNIQFTLSNSWWIRLTKAKHEDFDLESWIALKTSKLFVRIKTLSHYFSYNHLKYLIIQHKKKIKHFPKHLLNPRGHSPRSFLRTLPTAAYLESSLTAPSICNLTQLPIQSNSPLLTSLAPELPFRVDSKAKFLRHNCLSFH